MPRFSDEWVVQKTMFEYLYQGHSSSCCGTAHAMIQLKDKVVSQCSDWESDDHAKEKTSIWPPCTHELVSQDRVKARVVLKQHLAEYHDFLVRHRSAFRRWYRQEVDPASRFRIFQFSKDDIDEVFTMQCNISKSYTTVIDAVVAQLEHFQLTCYEDGRTSAEVFFEQHLRYEQGGFTVSSFYLEAEAGQEGFLDMFDQLKGPSLLPKRNQDSHQNDTSSTHTQSFRTDRRLIRLVIFRGFAQMAMTKYLRFRRTRDEDGEI